MKRSEPQKLSLRSMSRRPAETLLLIVGIASGIGTTAGGISMVTHLQNETKRLINSPVYREIVASTREEAEDMATSAYVERNLENVVLTSADFAAREEAPDVQYAYLANRTMVRILNANEGVLTGGFGGGGSGGGALREAPESVGNSDESGSGSAPLPQSEGGGTAGEATQQSDRLEELQERATQIEGPAPTLQEVEALQVTPEFFNAYGMAPAQGSLFTREESEEGSPVVVLGSELGQGLYEDGQALGRKILLRREIIEIIGIIEPTGTKYDSMAFTPARELQMGGSMAALSRRFARSDTIRFSVFEPERLDEAKAQLESWFNAEYGEGVVVLTAPGQEAKAAMDRNRRLVTIILFLAISGLLIASVNVSNILYARALRKRKMVGILKALGATRKAVFQVFMQEAETIGIAGAIFGFGVSIGFTRLLGSQFVSEGLITLPMVLGTVGAFALTFSLTVIPALQVSSTTPSEALRYE